MDLSPSPLPIRALPDEKLKSLALLTIRRSLGTTKAHAFWNELALKRFRNVSLLQDMEIVSPHNKGGIPSLHLDKIEARFLLAGGADGIISIYDLSKWGSSQENRGGKRVYKPVAQSTRVPFDASNLGHSSSIVAAEWYPVDTGAFVSASTDGSLLVWDTHSMRPVVCWEPFASSFSTSSVDCLHMSTWQGGQSDSLLAVGSAHDAAVKLVDIRSGSSSHSLTGHQGAGVTCVQWSPTCDVILASGGADGTIRLWDIRKAGSRSCLTVLDRDKVPGRRQRPYSPDYAHLRPKKAKLAPNNFQQVEQMSSMSSHGGSISALAFTPEGQSLVSTGRDGKLQLWDLRDGHLVSRQFQARGNRPPLDASNRHVPLAVQSYGNRTTMAWVGRGAEVQGFLLERGGKPIYTLDGHLDKVTSVETMDASMNLLSAGKDGMILSWGSRPVPGKKRQTAGQDEIRRLAKRYRI